MSELIHQINLGDYCRLRNELFSRHPSAKFELERRLARTAAVAATSADDIWRYMGDKPLFTNKSVTAGEPGAIAWEKYRFPKWQEMAGPEWEIIPRNKATALREDNDEDDKKFEALGALAIAFKQAGVANKNGNGEIPNISLDRLYRMRQLALWIKEQEDTGGNIIATKMKLLEDSLNADTPDLDLIFETTFCFKENLENRKRKAKIHLHGWGPATILHGLMDAGYSAVKPDIHMMYTIEKMTGYSIPRKGARAQKGQFTTQPATAKGNFAPTLEAIGHILKVTRDLAGRIKEGDGTPMKKAIREVDVVLMRASYETSSFIDSWLRTA